MDLNSNDVRENREGQRTVHVLTFSFTTLRTPPTPYLKKQVQYCRTTLWETISCESSTNTLKGLQSVPKLSATGF